MPATARRGRRYAAKTAEEPQTEKTEATTSVCSEMAESVEKPVVADESKETDDAPEGKTEEEEVNGNLDLSDSTKIDDAVDQNDKDKATADASTKNVDPDVAMKNLLDETVASLNSTERENADDVQLMKVVTKEENFKKEEIVLDISTDDVSKLSVRDAKEEEKQELANIPASLKKFKPGDNVLVLVDKRPETSTKLLITYPSGESGSFKRIIIRGLRWGDLQSNPVLYTLLQLADNVSFSYRNTDGTWSAESEENSKKEILGQLTLGFANVLDRFTYFRRYLFQFEIPGRHIEIVFTAPMDKAFNVVELWSLTQKEEPPPCLSTDPEREILARQLCLKNVPETITENDILPIYKMSTKVEFVQDYKKGRCALITFEDIFYCQVAHARRYEVKLGDHLMETYLMTEMVSKSQFMPLRLKEETEEESQTRNTFNALWQVMLSTVEEIRKKQGGSGGGVNNKPKDNGSVLFNFKSPMNYKGAAARGGGSGGNYNKSPGRGGGGNSGPPRSSPSFNRGGLKSFGGRGGSDGNKRPFQPRKSDEPPLHKIAKKAFKIRNRMANEKASSFNTSRSGGYRQGGGGGRGGGGNKYSEPSTGPWLNSSPTSAPFQGLSAVGGGGGSSGGAFFNAGGSGILGGGPIGYMGDGSAIYASNYGGGGFGGSGQGGGFGGNRSDDRHQQQTYGRMLQSPNYGGNMNRHYSSY